MEEALPKQKLKVVKKKLQWENPIDGYQYIFTFPNDILGDAQLIYCQLKDWRYEHSGRDFYKALKVQGLHDGDTIAHLNEFYPNGRGLSEKTSEKMRLGRGLKALNFLIQEAIKKEAVVLYCFSGKDSMQSFLAKHHFTKFNEWRYYKILSD
ncbi:MAG: hypothetical protein AAB870_05050 [Patescibacteria group bacterium]